MRPLAGASTDRSFVDLTLQDALGPPRLTLVEPLSYRTLAEGMTVLGRVAAVNDYDLRVSL